MHKQQKVPDKCPLCGGRVGPGQTTFAVDMELGLVVVRQVPAHVCEVCGESWLDDATARRLEAIVAEARRQRRQVEVLAYAP
jgi:YgiT-type zinc finger domain-containing protein